MPCHTSLFIFSLCHHVTFYIKDLDITFYSFYKRPRRTSLTFKVAVSHFIFYPRGALFMATQCISIIFLVTEWLQLMLQFQPEMKPWLLLCSYRVLRLVIVDYLERKNTTIQIAYCKLRFQSQASNITKSFGTFRSTAVRSLRWLLCAMLTRTCKFWFLIFITEQKNCFAAVPLTLLLFACSLVSGGHMDDSVRVNVECDLDLGNTSWRWRNANLKWFNSQY